MAEDKVEQREVNFRQLLPWTEIFRGFQVAMDPKKLLLAAGGILAMAFGWWLWALVFGSQSKPQWDSPAYAESNFQHKDDAEPAKQARQRAWERFREDRDKWNILWRAAGTSELREYTDAGDLAKSPAEYDSIKKGVDDEIESMKAKRDKERTVTIGGAEYAIAEKPYGALRTWPWFEERGPNPFLMVTGQMDKPWSSGQFGDWFLTKQAPVLIEPLRKFLTPVVLLLDPRSGTLNRLYFLLVIVTTLAVWALFGGAITRMASVQIARNEKVGLREAWRFVWSRYTSYLTAPLFPLVFIAGMVVLLSLYGFVFMIPWLGDILIAGLGWPLILGAGLVMAFVLVCLVGWPMMYATISAEGSDAFDAISRSYSYLLQSPWNYAWYSIVAIAYGAVVVFFVGFMGSTITYLGKWGVSQTPGIEYFGREPSFLFVYAPTSFNWRTLLLEGTKVGGQDIVVNGVIDPKAYDKYTGADASYSGRDKMSWANKTGAFLVAAWLYLFFLVVLGFGYSYFWSASTIIYLLMRRKVDDTDMDEIYLEEDETEESYSSASSVPPQVPSGGTGKAISTMVEAPALRSSAAPLPAPKPSEERVETPARSEAAVPARSEAAAAPGNDGDKTAKSDEAAG